MKVRVPSIVVDMGNNNVAFSNKKIDIFLWKNGHLCGNIYMNKDKNTTQGNLAELVGSSVIPIGVSSLYSLGMSVFCSLQLF